MVAAQILRCVSGTGILLTDGLDRDELVVYDYLPLITKNYK